MTLLAQRSGVTSLKHLCRLISPKGTGARPARPQAVTTPWSSSANRFSSANSSSAAPSQFSRRKTNRRKEKPARITRKEKPARIRRKDKQARKTNRRKEKQARKTRKEKPARITKQNKLTNKTYNALVRTNHTAALARPEVKSFHWQCQHQSARPTLYTLEGRKILQSQAPPLALWIAHGILCFCGVAESVESQWLEPSHHTGDIPPGNHPQQCSIHWITRNTGRSTGPQLKLINFRHCFGQCLKHSNLYT